MNAGRFTLTGKHVLAMLLGFFAVILVANAVFITLAVRSFPGEQEKKSYVQGLDFNRRIAERAAQDALGWSAELETVRDASGTTVFRLSYRTANGALIGGMSVVGVLVRPSSDGADLDLLFVETEHGVYTASTAADAGAWRLDAVADGARGERFRLEKRLTLR